MITNIDVRSRYLESYYCVSWGDEHGYRYHIWYDGASPPIKHGRLYKRAPDGDGSPRYLDAHNKTNTDLIEAVLASARKQNLFVLAGQQADQREQDKLEAAAREKREAIVRSHGMALLEALQTLVAAVEDGSQDMIQIAMSEARDAMNIEE